MQQQDFEQSLSKFFDKAGVRVIKKGEGYEDKDGFPSYVLLDVKRSSYYAAETDVVDNMEMEDNITKLAADTSLSQNNSYALYSLAKSIYSMGKDFTLTQGDDLSLLKRKAALIISEENSTSMQEYLKNNGYSIQAVPSKNNFLVMFLDENNFNKLSGLYKTYKGIEEDDDIAPIFEPKDDAAPENINLNKSSGVFDAETPLVSPQEEDQLPLLNSKDLKPVNNNQEESKEDLEEDEMLDNIDLNDLLKPSEDENAPKDDTEADLLYGKFLNEQTEKIEVSNAAPVEKNINEIPEGIISEEDIKEIKEDADGTSKAKAKMDKKQAKEEKKAAQLAKKKAAKEAAANSGEKHSILDFPGRLFSNLIGLIFFLPVYLLKKITGRFLPPFIIYWLAAVVAVFGLYQTAFQTVSSFIPESCVINFQEKGNKAIQTMQSFNVEVPKGEKISPVAVTSINMVKNDAVMFYGLLHGIDALLNKGYLLHYLLGLAALLLIIPVFRKIGKTLTIFSVLSYFLLPLAVSYQSKIIEYAFTLSEASLTASLVTFSVYVYPIIVLLILLFISSAFVPDEHKRSEVLP